MEFIDNTKIEIEVIKTEKWVESISAQGNNIFKCEFSDDEIDYNLTTDEIINMNLSSPITNDLQVINLLQYDNNINTQLILNPNSIKFNIYNDINKTFRFKLQMLYGIEKHGYVIVNDNNDFISIVNRGTIYDYNNNPMTNSFIDSVFNIRDKSIKNQLIGTEFDLIVTDNDILDDVNIIYLNIYSITYKDIYATLNLNLNKDKIVNINQATTIE